MDSIKVDGIASGFERTVLSYRQENFFQVVDRMFDRSPEDFKRCYPRRIIPQTGYMNPKYAAGYFMLMEKLGKIDPDDSVRMAAAVVSVGVLSLNFPVYFLDHKFGMGLMETDVPPDLTLGDLKFPLSSFVLFLPEEFRSCLYGCEVPFVGVSKISPGRVNLPWSPSEPVILEKERIILSFMIFSNEGTILGDYSYVQSPDKNLELAAGSAQFTDYVATDLGAGVKFPKDIETKVFQAVISAVLKMLAVLGTSASNSFIEAETCLRHRSFGKKPKDELWSGNFIGRKISFGSGKSSESRGSVRVHWRRGHLKRQHYGKGNSQVKMVWILPVHVNAE